jgi:hypothetical protein
MRVQGTMASVTGGPVYTPDRGSLPLARQIGLGPHVAGFRPLLGAVRRRGGAPIEDTPQRTLTPLRSDMSENPQGYFGLSPVRASASWGLILFEAYARTVIDNSSNSTLCASATA